MTHIISSSDLANRLRHLNTFKVGVLCLSLLAEWGTTQKSQIL